MQKILKISLALVATGLLAGCQMDVLNPSGWVAVQQRNLLVISTLLMLIVIIPVLVMAVYFPWKYRASRKDKADYNPEFTHSGVVEAFVWGIPILIVIALGWYTFVYTHRLDPYRPLDHAGTPLEVEAVAMDWKWLFIYPEQNIATVNELVIPADRPINLRLTASSMMNTFSVPALAGMIYAMPGMETKLHIVADEEGTFAGRSAHYSGPGYSQMTFDTVAVSDADFDGWVEQVRAEGDEMSRETYVALDVPTIDEPVHHFSSVAEGLFDRVVGLCVAEGRVCMHDMMMQDRMGGGGLAGVGDKHLYEYDKYRAQDTHGELKPIAADVPAGHGAAPQHGGHDVH